MLGQPVSMLIPRVVCFKLTQILSLTGIDAPNAAARQHVLPGHCGSASVTS